MNLSQEDECDILTVICFEGELICCSISDVFRVNDLLWVLKHQSKNLEYKKFSWFSQVQVVILNEIFNNRGGHYHSVAD